MADVMFQFRGRFESITLTQNNNKITAIIRNLILILQR